MKNSFTKQSKAPRVPPGSITPLQDIPKRAKPTPDPDHQVRLVQLFSSRWYTVKDLHRIEQESGLAYKRGKFSNTEAQTINNAVQRFLVSNSLTFAEFRQQFFDKRGHKRLQDFFVTSAQQLPGRPVIHVYHYLRRQYHPGNWQGQWTQEEDEHLKTLFTLHGPKWEVIGEQIGRFHVSCKDRYRIIRQSFSNGRWSEEEVERLRSAIIAWRKEGPRDVAVWAWIAGRVETRSWMQCLVKYSGSLESHMRRNPNGEITKTPLKWTDQEDLILIHRIYDLVVEDESEIIWSQLIDDSWDHWSASCLSRRWTLLRRRVYRERFLDMDTVLETLMRAITPLSPDKIDAELELNEHELDSDDLNKHSFYS